MLLLKWFLVRINWWPTRKAMEEQLNAGALWVINPHCFLTFDPKQFWLIWAIPRYAWWHTMTLDFPLPFHFWFSYITGPTHLSIWLYITFQILWIFMIPLKASEATAAGVTKNLIGRVCRVARRLNAGTLIATRVITRSLMKYQRYFRARIGKAWWPWAPGCVATWTWGSSAKKSLAWAQCVGIMGLDWFSERRE